MKKRKLDNYELFYMEIPQSDYLDDIETGIEDAYQPAADEAQKGLSDQQVSELARDSLDNETKTGSGEELDQSSEGLLTDEPDNQ